jgi:hypothetical protein
MYQPLHKPDAHPQRTRLFIRERQGVSCQRKRKSGIKPAETNSISGINVFFLIASRLPSDQKRMDGTSASVRISRTKWMIVYSPVKNEDTISPVKIRVVAGWRCHD